MAPLVVGRGRSRRPVRAMRRHVRQLVGGDHLLLELLRLFGRHAHTNATARALDHHLLGNWYAHERHDGQFASCLVHAEESLMRAFRAASRDIAHVRHFFATS